MKSINNHRQILNAMSIFASMHFINMLVSVFRTKIASLWLGIYGVGILGLYVSSINLMMSVVNMGLSTSIVRYLSGQEDLPKKIKIIDILLITSGIFGGVLVFIFAPQISILTFENTAFSWAFRLISISIIFKQLSTGYASILQSQNKVIMYANANLLANVLGILVVVPMYYYFRIEGIVYAILAISIIEAAVFYLFLKKIKSPYKKIQYKEIKQEAKKLTKQSLSFMLSGFITLLATFLVQIFVSRNSNYQILGIYVAGFSLLNNYVSLIFTAMGMQYFPRIAKLHTKSEELSTEVNNQLQIGIKILTPILLALLLLAPWVVKILFSKEFLESIHYIHLALLGVFFKLFSFITGYVIISKAKGRLVLYNSIIFNTLFVIVHCIAFYFFQLKGIAIASTLYYLLHLLGNYYTVYTLFSLKIHPRYLKKYIVSATIIALSVGLFYFIERHWIKNIIVLLFLAISLKNLIKYLNKIYRCKTLE